MGLTAYAYAYAGGNGHGTITSTGTFGFSTVLGAGGAGTPGVIFGNPARPTSTWAGSGGAGWASPAVNIIPPPPYRRVLVTGSREWTDRQAVFDALSAELTHGVIVVVHGDCPTGADAIAQEFHLKYYNVGAAVERHPAKWEKCTPDCYHLPRYRRDGALYCPAAGNYRNQEMVDKGADVCHAFPLKSSRGTWHCMNAAKKAGIKVINHGFGSDEWKTKNPTE